MADDIGLDVQVDLAAANARRLQRDVRGLVVDIARIRDTVRQQQTVQSEEDTTNNEHSNRHS